MFKLSLIKQHVYEGSYGDYHPDTGKLLRLVCVIKVTLS